MRVGLVETLKCNTKLKASLTCQFTIVLKCHERGVRSKCGLHIVNSSWQRTTHIPARSICPFPSSLTIETFLASVKCVYHINDPVGR